MADWDADGPQLQANLERVLEDVAHWADQRDRITAATIKRWHRHTMAGLDVPDPTFVGRFRASRASRVAGVTSARTRGTKAELVRARSMCSSRGCRRSPAGSTSSCRAVRRSIATGWRRSSNWPRGRTRNGSASTPFSNGNGRTARILTNAVLMRYGLPPVLRLRPRPPSPYGHAGAEGMESNAKPMEALLRRLLKDFPKDD